MFVKTMDVYVTGFSVVAMAEQQCRNEKTVVDPYDRPFITDGLRIGNVM